MWSGSAKGRRISPHRLFWQNDRRKKNLTKEWRKEPRKGMRVETSSPYGELD